MNAVKEISKDLISITHKFMADAGFDSSAYKIINHDDRYYLEVWMDTPVAMDYLISGLQSSEFANVLELKKYDDKKQRFLVVTFI